MRADGKKLKNLHPMYQAEALFMKHRWDSMNMITIDIPVEPLHEYVNKKRKTDNPTNHLAIIIAAYVRTLAKYPELNRFVVNKKFYARNEITVGMVVLNKNTGEGDMNKMYFEPTDTLDIVTAKINKYIEENRGDETTNDTEKALKILTKIPGLFSAGVSLAKFADKHGLLPKAVINASPFHASLLITNLSSIRTNHIYHHVYEFGTTGIGMAMGNKRYITEKKGGEFVHTQTMPIGVVMDERIASGAFFAIAFREFQKYCKNPEILETPPQEVKKDPNL